MEGVGAAEVVAGHGHGRSIYLREEVSVLARVFNHMLKNETTIADRIPIDDQNDDLFNTFSDGIVLIHVLRTIDPNLIDMTKVCLGDNLNVFQVRLNLGLALEACKKIIHVVGIDSQSFLDKTPDLILGILWQLVRHIQGNKIRKRIAGGKLPRKLTKELSVEYDRYEM